MAKAFGHDFVLVNDIRQEFKDSNGITWIHLATVKRGLKEYVAFKLPQDQRIYIEEADIKEPGLFKFIDDENEFNDLYQFLLMNGSILVGGVGEEIKIANVFQN